jgi:hypothetical protein
MPGQFPAFADRAVSVNCYDSDNHNRFKKYRLEMALVPCLPD